MGLSSWGGGGWASCDGQVQIQGGSGSCFFVCLVGTSVSLLCCACFGLDLLTAVLATGTKVERRKDPKREDEERKGGLDLLGLGEISCVSG